jgi:SCY1-like protein 2
MLCLGCYENLPAPLPQQLTSFKLYDVEIKYGLLQVSNFLSIKKLYLIEHLKFFYCNLYTFTSLDFL